MSLKINNAVILSFFAFCSQSKDDELSFLSSAHEEWRRSILPFETADSKEFNNELASTLREIR